jgi:uncharacterized membrane protein YtjA (UPF0391 family)
MIRLALLLCVFSTGAVLFGFDGLSKPAATIAVALFSLPALGGRRFAQGGDAGGLSAYFAAGDRPFD